MPQTNWNLRRVFVRVLAEYTEDIGCVYKEDLAQTVIEREPAIVGRNKGGVTASYETDTDNPRPG